MMIDGVIYIFSKDLDSNEGKHYSMLKYEKKKPRLRDPREYYPWLNMFSSPQLYLGYQAQCVVHSIKSL